jgi:hypothetical protein
MKNNKFEQTKGEITLNSPLTFKQLQKRHKENPQDKELHKTIEKAKVDEKEFEKLLEKATRQEPFDKKK